MQRPYFIASSVLVCVHALWLVYAHGAAENLGNTGLVLWLVVPLAAFLAAVFARKRQFLVGLAVALPAALLFVVSNSVFALLGHRIDYPGVLGAVLVFGMTLPLCCLLAAAGAGLARLSPFRVA
jgi:hypothetical protein